MMQINISVIAFLSAIILYILRKLTCNKTFKLGKKQLVWSNVIFKAIGVVVFCLYMPLLFSREVISQYHLVNGSMSNSYYPYDVWAWSSEKTLAIMILKWATTLTVAVNILNPFFDKDESDLYTAIISPIVIALNFVFWDDITYSVLGNAELNWQITLYAVLFGVILATNLERLISLVLSRNFDNFGKRLLKLLGYVAFYTMGFMPLYFPRLIFGYDVVGEPLSFSLTHRILIYICVVAPFAIYFGARNRSQHHKRYIVTMLSLSAFIQYFCYDSYRGGLNSFPLHLCNTAIMLMFFAFAFKIESVYYFTYLVNVLGAIFAILMPNYSSGSLFIMNDVLFWYNHTYAVILPILGVALHVFRRPNFKMIGKAIFAFSLYVMLAATMNAWLNNSPSLNPEHAEIDYFFLYSDFFIEKFPWALPLKNVVWEFQVGDTMLKYFPLYQGAIYVVFIAMMFVVCGVYTVLFNVADDHGELLRLKRLQRVDELNLLKELNGRPLNSPLNTEGTDMIKINHFSKTYAGSTVKAVDDVNLEIKAGEVFGFIGHNGAGKSTTIKSLVGIQTITEGSIEIEGYDIARQPLEAKSQIGYVSDNHAVYEKLTGREYVSYVADLYMVSEEDKNARLNKYAEMFKLTDALDREIKSYSHGMKQKIMVISALIHNPKVWVLDEPLTGLDPTSSYQIKQCMREHADNGNIVFFSSHVIEVVEKICDRIAIIANGKICRVATIDELKKEGLSLEQLYLSYQQSTATVAEEAN